MPWLPKGPCSTPACRGRAERRGKCETCAAAAGAVYDKGRGSAAARGYDAAWKRCRRLFLAANPWCEAHGAPCVALEVDHKESIAERPDLRLSWSNLRGLCKSAHSRRTATDQSFGRGRGRVL